MEHNHTPFGPGMEGPVPDTAIAIVGMSCRFAQARGIDAFWDMLSNGREAIQTYSEEELLAAGCSPSLLRNRNYVPRGAPLDDMECFDASLFGLSRRDAAIMDPQHRHFLECTWEALENAAHTPQGFDGVIGVFAGTGHNAYMPYNLLTNPKLVRDVGLFLLRHTSNDKDFLTTRASYLFDLKGPSINVQTACSTSLVAIHLAAQTLLNGECDMAIAGGSSIELPHRQGYLYEEGEILSPDGHCRPFDAASKGTVFGSGVAVVVLRRLSDAIAAGDHIYAVLRGSAINNDGAGKVGYLAPSVDGQAKVIAEALAMAAVDADQISYVETHGTGTPVGDPIEVAALTQAFRQTTDAIGHCAIGSVKANIGHTDTAAGAAGLIKVALAMYHRELPASLNFETPNPALALENSPFFVQSKHTPWASVDNAPRCAGISSLGVGGTNAHIILEEAPSRPASGPSRRYQLLLSSAKSAVSVTANVTALAAYLETRPQTSLPDAAFTLTMGRQHLLQRRFAVAASGAEASEQLQLAGQDASASDYMPDRKLAFLFCGAGPQHVDMTRDLYLHEPVFTQEVDRGLAIMDRLGVGDIRRWLFPVETDRAQASTQMERPSIALPALFIIQIALARLWQSIGITPTAMIGHSSGEYAAAHLAGVIDLESSLRIVSARGRLFETIRDGGMLSVPLAEAELLPLLPADLSIAAINAPQLCVVSGPASAVKAFHAELARQEVEAQIVPIAVAAHSPLLEPILPEFRALMRTIHLNAPKVPFVSNLTGDWASPEDVTDPEYWVRHLRQTVRFTDGLHRLLGEQDIALLEVGPGRAMASLVRMHPDCGRQRPVISTMGHPDQTQHDDATWLNALGKLWSAGVDVDWYAYWNGEQRLRIPLPTYQFERQRHWYEPGKELFVSDTGDANDGSDNLHEWQYEPVWTRAFQTASAPLEGAALILEDALGVGSAIAAKLTAAGHDVITLRPGNRFARLGPTLFTVSPSSHADFGRLFEVLDGEGRLPTQIYHGWLITGSGRRQPDTARLQDLGFYSLIALARELAYHTDDTPVEIALLTDRVQRVAGDRDLMPVKATAVGAVGVIATEYPSLHIRAIDIVVPQKPVSDELATLAEMAVCEVAEASSHHAVAYRDGERWVQEFAQVPVAQVEGRALSSALRNGATYLITGGLGGLGLTIATHLASLENVRIVLIGRSALPHRDGWADVLADGSADAAVIERIRKLMRLEALGAKVDLLVADVGNARGLRSAIRQLTARIGPIHGVFHAAGALDDGLIETKSRSAMSTVLRPKLFGTLALEYALQGQQPDFIMLFSSVSAFSGLPGQVDYAAANAFLDAYAQAHAANGRTPIVSVGWSPWLDVGMAATLERNRDQPVDALPEGRAIEHPFLEQLHLLSADEVVVSGVLSPERHWLLDEHRLVEGGALIPGTGFLELAQSAHALINTGAAAMSDVTFLTPFAVADGAAREIRVHLKRRVGDTWGFSILGKPLETAQSEWVEHASGRIGGISGSAAIAPIDVDQIEARCPAHQAGLEQSHTALRFGPRWSNIQQARFGANEAVLRLAMNGKFHGDFDHVMLHPALLDFATAGAQSLIPGYVPGQDFFVPFSYRRLTLHTPLPPSIISHIRYRPVGGEAPPMATFDITIADEDGRVLAEIADFTMMRMRSPGLLPRTSRIPSTRDQQQPASRAAQIKAILPEEGLTIVESVLAWPVRPHVIISRVDVNGLLANLRASQTPVQTQADITRADGDIDMPSTPMEKVIAELWSDLLGVRPIGRNDDFFDLGGHSLLAVQFTNRLRKKTGKTLSFSALLEMPTVAALAKDLDPKGGEAANTASNDNTLAAQSDIVTIRAGGNATPVFFVHDGLGETLLYRGLATRLDPNRTIYGIEPLRNVVGGFAHTSIQEMAANYIERMQTIQPRGPYLLAGLCAGGVIAFEMALQLEALGETVAYVGIIDAADVAASKRSFYIARARIGRIRALFAEEDVRTLIPELGRRAASTVIWEIQARRAAARDRRVARQMAAVNDIASCDPSVAVMEPSLPFLKLYETAHSLHRPKGVLVGGSVALFKANGGNGDVDDMPYQEIFSDIALGWGKRVADQVALFSVPGGHSSALQEPHVRILAAQFQDAIDSAMERVDEVGMSPITVSAYASEVEAAE